MIEWDCSKSADINKLARQPLIEKKKTSISEKFLYN